MKVIPAARASSSARWRISGVGCASEYDHVYISWFERYIRDLARVERVGTMQYPARMRLTNQSA